MKALQIVKPRECRIVELDMPKAADDEIVIRMDYAAMCNQNDYKIFYGMYGDLIKYPCDPGVFGHEGVGTITEIGKKVKGLKVGGRVIMMGDGGPMLYRECVTRKADMVAPIDKSVPTEEAAVLELFGCAHHCLGIVGDVTNRSVAVIGLGPAGLAILQMLMLKGAKDPIGIDLDASRREAAKKEGVKKLYDPSDAKQYQALLDAKIHTVIDATGVPKAILSAFDLAQHEAVIFGFTNQPFEVDQSKWFQKELTIKNSKVQTMDDLRAVARLLEQKKIRTRNLISEITTYDHYEEAVEKLYKKQAIKILLKW